MKVQVQRLVDEMQAASSAAEAVELLRRFGDVLGMRLPCALYDVSGNEPVRDDDGRRIADLLGWPAWMTNNWFDHAYVRQHPIYLRCRFESWPFGTVYVETWRDLEPLSPAQQQMRKDTERFGIVAQITAPIHLPFGRVACVLWSTQEPTDLDSILDQFGHYIALFAQLFMAIVQKPLQPTLTPRQLTHLTDRQVACLHWLAKGKTIGEAATILGISVHTVREHLREICERLHAVNTPNAIAIAAQFGILERVI